MACGYNISGLKGLLTALPSYISVIGYTAHVASCERVDVKNVQFEGESELNGTYAFGKKLTVTVNGLYVPSLAGKRLIIEAEDGSFYLIDEEFGASVTWRYSLSSDEDETVWDIEVPSNLQIKPCVVVSITQTEQSCGYDAFAEPYAVVSPKASTLVDADRGLYLSDVRTSFDKGVAYTQSWDGVKYENSVQVTLPLNGQNVELSDELQRFILYKHTLAVRSSSGLWRVIGTEHGADVQVDIDTSSGTLKMTFSEACDNPCITPSTLTFFTNEDLFYDYVKYAHDGTEGFICEGDGTAIYLLQRGFYQDGTPTENYYAKNGYANRFPNLNITGVFYGTKTFYNSGCVVQNRLTTTFPSTIKFNTATRSYTGKVYSDLSEWEVESKPSFVTVTPDHEDAGTTDVTIALANTQHSYMTGSIIFTNGSMYQVVTVTYNAGQVVPDPEIHDASGFTVKLRGNADYPVTLVSSPQGIETEKYSSRPPKWRAAIPSNNTTSARAFTWEFTNGNVTQYVTVTQQGCYEQWKPSGGYICDNGNSYVKEVRLISYFGSSWTPTGEWRKGDLLEADAPYCQI